MATELRIPNLGEGAESGVVVTVYVKVGDRVAKDQTLLELENEKAVAPIPSTHSGVVAKVYVKAGDKVAVGQAIVSLTEDAGQASAAAPSPKPEAPKIQASVPSRPVSVAGPADSDYVYSSKSGFGPPASPSIRKMAKDLGIDLTRVKGSQSGGRIVLEDVQAYIQRLQSGAASGQGDAAQAATGRSVQAEKIDFSKWGPIHKKALTSLRQKISQKMLESWQTIPHVTQFDEADITNLLQLRKQHLEAYEKKGARLTLTVFVMKAVVEALKKFPGFNASLDESAQEMVYKDYYHIGIAVDTEAGLIVPVVRDVDKKNLFVLSKELEELAEKTRSRKISIEELKGGTFTISNLGGIGGSFFTPIINKPEVAILGLGKGAGKLPLSLSYDHRVIDGADGARFIRAIATALENFKLEDVKL